MTRRFSGRRTAVAGAFAALAAALGAPATASAHALVGRQDLPIPEWLFAWGASVVLIVSFVALSLAWREPRFEDDSWRPVAAGLSRALVNRATEVVCGLIGVALLGLAIYSGLYGTVAPDRNLVLTLVFVTVVLGFVVLSVLFGDVFRAFNPWRAVARVVSAGFRAAAGGDVPAPLRYPERLGRWPAVAGLFGYLWLELVYGQSGFQTVGLTPHTVAIATTAYSAYTFVGMALFGIEKWCERGETFSVYFGMFASLAAFEVRDRTLGRRRRLTGSIGWAAVPGSLALVLLTIGGTTFDGAQEGTLQQPIADTFKAISDAGLGPVAALRITNSLYLVGTLAFVTGLYFVGIRGMRSIGRRFETGELGRMFAHSFIPIGIAYLVAHYFSLFVFQEQAQFTYLLSDPLGDGSDLFGTASSGINYGLIGANLIWYVQVGALVAGHVTALAMGHDRALAAYGNLRQASRSQYWMLALMVGFTSLGLFLLSQANG